MAATSTTGGAFGSADVFPGVFSGATEGADTNGNSFSTYSVSFRAVADGSAQVVFDTNEAGNVGPLLDNVSLDVSAAPEPATWAMLLLGFFGIGGMVRLSRQRIAGSALTA